MTAQLIFKDRIITPVEYQGQIWFTSVTIARALNYARTDYIAKLFRVNADEFSPEMTQVIDNPNTVESTLPKNVDPRQKNLAYKVRIFSLRGAHLIAMFARTPVAKEFRKWLLDLIEHHYGEPVVTPAPAKKPASEPLSANDMNNLTRLVWLMSNGMRFDRSWSNGMWHCLRSVTGRPSPERFCVDDLPLLAAECSRLLKITSAYNTAVYNFEKDVIRLVVRQQKEIEPLIAMMGERMHDMTERCNAGLLALDRLEERGVQKLIARQ